MTKVTFIGQEPTKESKNIELVKYYHSGKKSSEKSIQWKFCTLIKRNAKDGLDLILCGDSNDASITYLGHWNDGTTSNPETVCTVLGEDVAAKKGKGIEFVKILHTGISNTRLADNGLQPIEFENIEVIRKGTVDAYDIFFAYNSERLLGGLYLGHLNDGFVE